MKVPVFYLFSLKCVLYHTHVNLYHTHVIPMYFMGVENAKSTYLS